jgi:hypothetical protein
MLAEYSSSAIVVVQASRYSCKGYKCQKFGGYSRSFRLPDIIILSIALEIHTNDPLGHR